LRAGDGIRSNTRTARPACAIVSAAINPAGPAPTTATAPPFSAAGEPPTVPAVVAARRNEGVDAMADGFLSGLTRRAYETRDSAEDYGRDAGRRAREGAADARGELRRLWSQMEDIVERNYAPAADAARTAGSYARDYARDGRDYAYDVADQLRTATRAQPLVAIGIAVAATFIITSLLSSGKRR
jgi:hypothetical protein